MIVLHLNDLKIVIVVIDFYLKGWKVLIIILGKTNSILKTSFKCVDIFVSRIADNKQNISDKV